VRSTRLLRRAFAAVALAALAGGIATSPARAADAPEAKPDAAAVFFKSGAIPRLQLTVDDDGLEKWKTDPRAFVRCTLKENEKTVYEGVGVKLKGAAGSFRDLDQKPAFTLKLDKFGGDTPFHGLEKFYLNNSVQDDTYLHEWLGAELFRAAGLPAPRITHARVWFNGKDFGLYVLKEGHDKKFLRRNFDDPTGNYYDGGFCLDVDGGLERDEGKGPADGADLADLAYAATEPDPVRAHPLLERRLDVDRFLTFMALERMIGHWDGYCGNRNNYRLYVDPKTGQASFVPHGMDQIFGDADVSVHDEPSGMVARAVLRDAGWRDAYYRRIGELLPLFTPVERWHKRLDEVAARLKGALAGAAGPQAVGGLKSRLAARVKSLTAQAKLKAPEPVVLEKGQAIRLRSWRPVPGAGPMKLAQVIFAADRVLRWDSAPTGDSLGSWRTTVFLAPGRYRLEAKALTDEVVAAGPPGKGGLHARVEGGAEGERLDGKGTWRTLAVEFDVAATPQRVELVLELSSSKGTAYVKLGSLRLERVDG
jgi:hypothetical protein